MKTLKQAAIGDTVKVVKLHGEGAVKRRIMDMGITRADIRICGNYYFGSALYVPMRAAWQACRG